MICTTEYTRRLEGFLVSQGWRKLDAPVKAGSEAAEHLWVRSEFVPNDGRDFDSYYWNPVVEQIGRSLAKCPLRQYYRADAFAIDEKHFAVNVQTTEFPTVSDLQARWK